MAIVVQHFHIGQYLADKQLSTTKSLKRSSERLSSGYRINRSADDAAGLAVSEKIRAIRRSLKQGLRNIDDGISFTRTVEAASQEMHNMLHRMQELAIESANGIYDDDVDRNALDLEYQQLIDEIDEMTEKGDFNGVPLFEKHLSAYEYNEGDVVHNSPIKINSKNDTLTVGYSLGEEHKECTVQIPHGTYSVEETADIIDTLLYEQAPELIIGVNTEKQFTMQAEGGSIDHISGTGASLFYDTVVGSSDGYLLGVTVFGSDVATMTVFAGENDTISFRVGNTDDTLYSIQLAPGRYTRPQLIDAINQKIEEEGIPGDVKAVATENDDGKRIIGLASKKTITGLAGNFIKIDGRTSPIYDICKYGYIDNTQAVLSGTKRIPTDLEIVRGRNEYFVLDFAYYGDDGAQITKKVRFDLLADGENVKTYASPNDLLNTLKTQLEAADVPFTLELNSRGGLEFTSEQFGDKCSVKLDKSNVPSAHMVYDLFDASTLVKVAPGRGTSQYTRAIFTAYKSLGPTVNVPADENTLSFNVVLSDDNEADASEKTTQRIDVVIPAKVYSSTDELVIAMNDYLDNNYPDVADKLQFSIDTSNAIKLYAEGNNGSDVESISVISSCSGYKRLIQGTRYYDSISVTNGKETAYKTGSSSVGGTGRPNVTSTAGTTTTDTSYKEQVSRTSYYSGNYLTYSGASVNNVQGTTVYEENPEDVVDDVILYKTPAKLTLGGVLSQFTAHGTSLKDLSFSLDITDDKTTENIPVSIPKGSTSAEALDIIRNALGDKATVSSSGNDLVITSKYEGDEAKFSNVSGSLLNRATRNSNASKTNAVVDVENNKVYVPATLTVQNVQSHIPKTVDAASDKLIFTAGHHNYDLTLAHKTYNSVGELCDEINRLISLADGGDPATTVEVGSDGKSLVFTGPYNESGSITIDSASSSKLGFTKVVTDPTSSPNYNPATGCVEDPATIRAEGIDTHFPKEVTSANNTITMDYTRPNPTDPDATITETLTITIPENTYNSASQLTDAINAAIAADPALSGKISASYSPSGSNKGLTFTTVNGGDGYKLTNLGGTFGAEEYINTAPSTGGVVDEDNNIVKFPATAKNTNYATLFSGDGLEITDNNNFVSLNINGTKYEFSIINGEYAGSAGRADLTQQLQDNLTALGADVTVTDDGSTLTITTNEGGSGKSISLGGANTAPYFKGATSVSAPRSTKRVENPCYILGKNNVSSVEIKDYENTMSFDFSQDGTTYKVDVTVAAGTYTADTLVQAIQDSINATLPANSLEVYKNSSGNIGIRSATITPIRSISNFEGLLFDKVFQNANYTSIVKHGEKVGTSTGSYFTYIVGRNDMEPESADEIALDTNVIIYPGLNDQLVFDLRYDGETYKVELEIPPGHYEPYQIAEAIQQAGRESLAKMTDKNGNPFPVNGFNATIGLSSLGIPESNTSIKSNDKLVLSFMAPDDGTIKTTDYIIDGVRGNAAYRIFYEATQSPTPSKVIGKADLTNGVMIRAGENNVLTYDINGKTYSVTLPSGSYTCDQICDYLNEQYENTDSIVRVTNMKEHLMFYTTENGNFDLGRFRGTAADTLFYGGDKRETDTEIGIHTGRRTDTYIWYMRTRVDDHLMRINTTGISTAERALKAIDRLEHAVNYLSKWRALTGANENRSRHTYARNQTYIENLEDADSTLRDTDMATEMAQYAKQQILLQAQNAMMNQAKQQQSSIMDVLA